MARTRSLDYETKRDAILVKSAELFAKFGYAGSSISMIAQACGISKALLYHYYPDKEAVLFDVLSSHLEHLLQVAQETELATPNAEDRLYALSAALLESYRDADAQHQVQIAALKLLPPEKQDVLRAMERRLVDVFAQAIADAVPVAMDGRELKALTMTLFGMLNWHYLWFKEGKGLTRAEFARLATTLLTSGADDALRAIGKGGAEAKKPAKRAG